MDDRMTFVVSREFAEDALAYMRQANPWSSFGFRDTSRGQWWRVARPWQETARERLRHAWAALRGDGSECGCE